MWWFLLANSNARRNKMDCPLPKFFPIVVLEVLILEDLFATAFHFDGFGWIAWTISRTYIPQTPSFYGFLQFFSSHLGSTSFEAICLWTVCLFHSNLIQIRWMLMYLESSLAWLWKIPAKVFLYYLEAVYR